MYSIHGYGTMIGDRVRTDAYAEALRRAIAPGSVVVDIGCGTGIFSLLACRFGARRVIAIEPDAAIQVARETVAANGFASRVEFIQDLSTRVELPERADVIVSDLRGILPLFSHHLASIVDARTRFLAPGGTLIPQRDTLWAAVVDAPEAYAKHVEPWEGNDYGFNLRRTRGLLVHTWRQTRLGPEQLLSEPHCWATLDYRTLTDTDARGEAIWRIERAGTGHGLQAWFDAELADSIGFTNAPTAQKLVYGSAFFPWPEPVALRPGDEVRTTFRAAPVGDDYIWCWNTRVLRQTEPDQPVARFEQSTFFGSPLSAAQLRKGAAAHVPALTEDGEIDRFVLSLMDGSADHSLGTIAARLRERFPTRFASDGEALTRASDLSKRYSR